ncbi:MAG: acyl-CoA dehydrogenase family protein [Phenylobacterium sp.]|uniref:acyl-CoA dehydrogenase family protein n=1 Tax=Phenylobacterium sp. TaxID=1871053 RepID=UPI001B68AB41|nr:acyl-CoA dehydrogenase family protein [Phenylobacterium sp.]MBP7648276.1 acyl-CoA dehydrogenase family protein [Phenylobacterium sp.]MBP7814829.1 acyl-CoA dehydrogenase family protein [Phenylobacterium sp.]MBP9753372.1 acyl-CoA dehydrogenase family protein [Phenylobacterium sp.]MDP1600183.1 acyl-CoA dehydrogenase family protein [Phenylobacterium sp.]MDP3593580.1 acyl-CoA dehydrogenase family protein [Phenylobacterium sp.]
MADFGSTELDGFRLETRGWLQQNFPTSLVGRSDLAALENSAPVEGDFKLWKDRMADKGWGVPTWPVAYGGGGLSAAQLKILREEMAAIGAWNPIVGMGIMMFGPTLLEYGTDAQKQQHIPPIARGELRWCQGYSEPGAGSDLASLQTRAEDKGDHFLINGQKIWTSGAQWSDWCFCLVRTDATKKHEGISFVLIDMRTPGVETRPIKLIAGSSPFCETFFTDVKVPKENLVGPLNGGWTVGKRLLEHERNSLSGGTDGPPRVDPADLTRAAKAYIGVGADGRLVNSDFRTRMVQNQMDAHAYALTLQRSAAAERSDRGPSAAVSIMKLAASKLHTDTAELIVEAMGTQGLGWEGESFSAEEIAAGRQYLRIKSSTIAGGSTEVQNNIISKRVLGLPDPTSK